MLTLSDDQVARFCEDGFLILDRIVDPEEARRLADRFEPLFAGEFETGSAAGHDEANIIALGGSIDFADAIWRSDIMLTDTEDENFSSAVLNWSYSWIARGKNTTATLEYFHNGFGIDDGKYDPATLADKPELLARIQRGELFTLGENYLAAAATIELAPLWLLTTSIFGNLDDDSMLLQIFSQHDLQQDLQLLVALNLPNGSDGSEFGGIDSGVGERTLAVGTSLFAQLGWYF